MPVDHEALTTLSEGTSQGRFQRVNSSSALASFRKTFKSIGELRDSFLVAVTTLYILGYVVWSYSAWKNNLGLLPALDPQYFLAGIAPILILIASYVAFRYLRSFLLDKWPRLVAPQARGIWRFIRVSLFFMFYGYLLLLGTGPILWLFLLLVYVVYRILKRWVPKISFTLSKNQGAITPSVGLRFAVLFFLFVVALILLIGREYFTQSIFPGYSTIEDLFVLPFIIGLIFLPPGEGLSSVLSTIYKFFVLYVGAFFFVFIATIFYLETLYPDLPQEFGGVRPRYAYLDLKTEQFSMETRKSLASMDSGRPAGQGAVRTVKVEVLYWGSGVILIRSQGKTFRILESAVHVAEFPP